MIDSTPTEATYPALKAYVSGEWLGVGDRRTQEVLNPATGKSLGDLPVVDSTDLDCALESADSGFRLWRQADPGKRAAVLEALFDAGLPANMATHFSIGQRFSRTSQSGRAP